MKYKNKIIFLVIIIIFFIYPLSLLFYKINNKPEILNKDNNLNLPGEDQIKNSLESQKSQKNNAETNRPEVSKKYDKELDKWDEKKATLAELSDKEDFTYQVKGGYFARAGAGDKDAESGIESSGKGSGVFIGKNFVFKKGNCDSLNNFGQDEILGCMINNLDTIWCARNKIDESIQYEIKFKSWLKANKKCYGECHNNKTSFLIIKK